MHKFVESQGRIMAIFEDGSQMQASPWLEKAKNKWHYKLAMPNPSNRQYFTKELVDKAIAEKGSFDFDTKTSEPRTLGNWKERLTPEELAEYEACIARAEELKQTGLNRKPKDPKDLEIERLKAMIAELEAKKK